MNPGSPVTNGSSHGPRSSISTTLLEQVKARDQEGWQRFVAIYGPMVYAWCRGWEVCADDAPDLVQEVFSAVLQNVARFRRSQPGDTFRGWMWRIAHSKAMDHFRRRKSEPQGVGGSDFQKYVSGLAEPAAAQSSSSVPPAQDHEQTAMAHRAVELIRGEFDPRTWELFERTTIQEERAVDVGSELGVQPSAVRQAKYRVLCRLRQLLADLCDLGEDPLQDGEGR